MTRGEIWWADYGIPFGSEPGFNRPVLIIQSDALNKSKIHTIIVVPLTTNLLLKDAPGNVFLDKTDSKLSKDSIVVVSQISVIDKKRLVKKESKIASKLLEEVEEGIKLVLEMR